MASPLPWRRARALVCASLLLGVAACPLGYDDHTKWQCARGFDSAGEPLWDNECLASLENGDEDDEGEYQPTKCDAYWGWEDPHNETWIEGMWDHMVAPHGEAYWECYSTAKEAVINAYPECATEAWSEDRWRAERLLIDKRCLPQAIRDFERSSVGWCSQFYTDDILPSCGADPYRDMYCTEVCPPPEVATEDIDDLDLDDDLDEAPAAPSPAYQTKCPVKKVAFKARDTVKEVGASLVNWVQRILPNLLTPPEAPRVPVEFDDLEPGITPRGIGISDL